MINFDTKQTFITIIIMLIVFGGIWYLGFEQGQKHILKTHDCFYEESNCGYITVEIRTDSDKIISNMLTSIEIDNINENGWYDANIMYCEVISE